jgi:hypothetical protein
MKKSAVILVIIIICGAKLNAQDTIVKYNNEHILAKVKEITVNEIKYTRADFIDGPVYVVNKTDVNYILFASGVKEHFDSKPEVPVISNVKSIVVNGDVYVRKEKVAQIGAAHWTYNGKIISEKELTNIMRATNEPEINTWLIKATTKKKQQYIGFGIFPMAIASIAFGVAASEQTKNNSVNMAYVMGSFVCGAAGVGCLVYDIAISGQRRGYVNKALRIYNQKY